MHEFGWSDTVVVCMLERVAPGEEKAAPFGYYILDTQRHEVSHAPDQQSLSTLLKRLSVPGTPKVAIAYPTTIKR